MYVHGCACAFLVHILYCQTCRIGCTDNNVCDEIKLFPPTCGHRLQPIDTDPSKYILMCVYIREELLTFTVGICGLYSQQQLLIDILIL